MKTLALEFKEIECDDETKYSSFRSTSKVSKTIINESNINDVFESTYSTLI